MENIFPLVLIIITAIVGLLWFLNKFIVFISKFEKNQITSKKDTNKKSCKNISEKIIFNQEWLKSTASFFPTLLTVVIVRSFIYEPFRIPSGSMMPTLLIGDFILVNKFIYGIKDPIFQKTLIKIRHPKRGDVVVFKYPKNPHINYIKRVVGLPDDRITYDPVAKEISICPRSSYNTVCKEKLRIKYSSINPSDFVQTFLKYNTGEINSDFFEVSKIETKKNSIRLMERKETLGNVAYCILTLSIAKDHLDMYHQQADQQIATWIVPTGQYFMMGDNRDNSSDSRYWGFVPEENLVGKATTIWMSIKKQEDRWPVSIRLKRIGRIC